MLKSMVAAECAATVAPLQRQIRELQARVEGRPAVGGATDLLSPAEVRALKRVRLARVFDALESGALTGAKRRGRGGRDCWQVKRSDADRWTP